MSLNWDWKDKIGELTIKQKQTENGKDTWNRYKISLYEGNALLIMLYEFKTDDGKEMWDMWSFWSDKTHAKRMLGLDKRWKDTYGKNTYVKNWQTVTRIRINKAKSRNWKEIVALMSEAFDDIQIELYTKEDK